VNYPLPNRWDASPPYNDFSSDDPMPDLSPIIDLFHQLPEGTGKVALLFALAMGIGALLAIKAPGGIKPEAWMNWDD